MAILTIKNVDDFYRIYSKNFGFGNAETDKHVNEIKADALKNGIVFTACDWGLKAIIVKKYMRAC